MYICVLVSYLRAIHRYVRTVDFQTTHMHTKRLIRLVFEQNDACHMPFLIPDNQNHNNSSSSSKTWVLCARARIVTYSSSSSTNDVTQRQPSAIHIAIADYGRPTMSYCWPKEGRTALLMRESSRVVTPLAVCLVGNADGELEGTCTRLGTSALQPHAPTNIRQQPKRTRLVQVAAAQQHQQQHQQQYAAATVCRRHSFPATRTYIIVHEHS